MICTLRIVGRRLWLWLWFWLWFRLWLWVIHRVIGDIRCNLLIAT
jgi:hypothetical protein